MTKVPGRLEWWPIKYYSNYLAYGALVVSCTFLLLLVRERDELANRYARLIDISDGPLQGRWYPVIPGRGLRGDSVCIANGASEPQFVFILSSTCDQCVEALRAWTPTLDSLQEAGGIRAVGVLLESDSARASAFVETHDPPMPVVMLSHPRWRSVLRVRSLPMMVLLDPDGRVRAARDGIPSEALIRDSIVDRLHLLQPTEPRLSGSLGCVEH